MATALVEGHQRFTFGDRWTVIKYDEHRDYRNGALRNRCSGKAVDFAAVHTELWLCLIEVKDFRGHRIENQGRLSGLLAEEVGLKVRDTVAGIIGAHRVSSSPNDWRVYSRELVKREPALRVVLWLEDDLAQTNPQRWQAKASTLMKLIKEYTCWLTHRVLVTNSQMSPALPDLTVENLAGAGMN